MRRRCAWLFGVLLLSVAIAAVPSIAIVDSYVGGSATHGYIEDGRFYVDPGHNQPIVEVTKTTWWTVYWVEWLWPWSALLPCWAGLFLASYGMGPNWSPRPPMAKEMPPSVLRACAAGGVFTVLASLLFWKIVAIPWATLLFGYAVFCLSVGWTSWLYCRALKETAIAEPK